ncbi:MAG: sensor histidine kinase [Candidatus Acidiferrales bacterium]
MEERSKRVFIAVALGLLVAAINQLLDWELARLGVQPAATPLNDATIGLVAGWCAYAWASFLEERNSRAAFEEKLRHEGMVQERAMLAAEVHDTLAQGFAGIIINLEAQQEFLRGEPEAQRFAHRALKIGQQSLTEARSLLQGLRMQPPVQKSLARSIEEMIEMLTGGTQVRAHCRIDAAANQLPAEIQWEVARIVREAVHNVVKHANAREVRVELSATYGQVRLCVEDDGCGFDSGRPGEGFGLSGMRERTKSAGGLWWVYTQPSQGTQVIAVIPLDSAMSAFRVGDRR